MVTRPMDIEQAVLRILQRYRGMTMDEVFTLTHPDLTWSEVFLAIDRLSRRQLIAVSLTGNTYRVALGTQTRAIAEVADPNGAVVHA